MTESASMVVDTILSAFLSILEEPDIEITEIGRSLPLPFLQASEIQDLCDLARGAFQIQPTVLHINTRVCIVGDLHGNFRDLVRILRIQGLDSNYLFLGDYVDRGSFSLECITLLFALALKHPSNFLLLRGNHEFRDIASRYGFRSEILRNYHEDVFDSFCLAFSYLPLAAVVQNRFFCVHGGIGPSVETIEEIEGIERPIESDTAFGVVQMLLWADPNEKCLTFDYSARGEGVSYGPVAVKAFLKRNNMIGIIRAHECVDGVVMATRMPVLTVFSASNYSVKFQNRSGVVIVGSDGAITSANYDPLPVITRDEATFFSLDHSTKSAVVHGVSVRRSSITTLPILRPIVRGSFAYQGSSARKQVIGPHIARPVRTRRLVNPDRFQITAASSTGSFPNSPIVDVDSHMVSAQT
jgi:diadenosine tetraphosphatase ApaH/serine/threonine PP2A family protein phosphatase